MSCGGCSTSSIPHRSAKGTLDPAAETYIEDAVREIGAGQRAKIVIHLPEAELATDDARSLPESIAHYFGYRAQQTRVELGRLMRRALINLAIGLPFLVRAWRCAARSWPPVRTSCWRKGC